MHIHSAKFGRCSHMEIAMYRPCNPVLCASGTVSPKVPKELLWLCSFAFVVRTINLRSTLSGFWRARHSIVNVSTMLFCRSLQLTHPTPLKPYTQGRTALLSPSAIGCGGSTPASGKQYCIIFASVGLVDRDASWEWDGTAFISPCLAYFTKHNVSSFIYVANGKSPLFTKAE